MELFRPFALITASLDGDVLHALITSEYGLTSGQIRNICKRGSRSGVIKVLDRLVEQGIVIQVPSDRIFIYYLNRNHLIADALQTIANAQSSWQSELVAMVAAWERRPEFVGIIGKARTFHHAATDPIELLIVLPAYADPKEFTDDIEHLRATSKEQTGSETVVLVHTVYSLCEVPAMQVLGWFYEHTLIYGNPQPLRDASMAGVD